MERFDFTSTRITNAREAFEEIKNAFDAGKTSVKFEIHHTYNSVCDYRDEMNRFYKTINAMGIVCKIKGHKDDDYYAYFRDLDELKLYTKDFKLFNMKPFSANDSVIISLIFTKMGNNKEEIKKKLEESGYSDLYLDLYDKI